MRKLVPLVALSAITLTGCGIIGGRPQAPDEFQVARNAPLVIPPDYSLTPPVAGTAARTFGTWNSSNRPPPASALALRNARRERPDLVATSGTTFMAIAVSPRSCRLAAARPPA